MHKDYIPAGNPQKLTWAETFIANLPAAQSDLGLSAGDVADASGEADKVVNAVKASAIAQAKAHELVAHATKEVKDNVDKLRTRIKNYKTRNGYTESIGKSLGIIGDDTPFDPSTFHSKLDAQAFPGHVTLKYKKDGVEGMNIYERLQGESEWAKLVMSIHSPYLDNRPLSQPGVPESREYKCIGVMNDHEVGQASAIVSVVFGG